MIDPNELIRVVGPAILVDVLELEFFWPDNLPKRWSQGTETTPP
jgi:hypothetical protein